MKLSCAVLRHGGVVWRGGGSAVHAIYSKRVSALDNRPIGEKGPIMERVEAYLI